MPIIESNNPKLLSMKGVHVYFYFLSNCSHRVSLTLAEKDIDFISHAVNLFAKENIKDQVFKIMKKI